MKHCTQLNFPGNCAQAFHFYEQNLGGKHGRFEAHNNRYDFSGAEVLNLPLPDSTDLPYVFMHTADLDETVSVAERDVKEAVNLLLSSVKPIHRNPSD